MGSASRLKTQILDLIDFFDRFDNEFRGTLTNLQTQVVVAAVPSVLSIKRDVKI